MKEKLIIKNFGPIKSVNLDLGKITVLIGEQATGKSTVVKVLSMCRYFSYIVNYTVDVEKQNEFHNNEQFLKGLRDWGIYGYLQEDSIIFYKNELYKFEFRNKVVTEYEKINEVEDYKKEYFETETRITPISKSNDFSKLLQQLEDLKYDELKYKESAISFFQTIGWTPNENFYRLNVKKVMNNPLFVPTERGFQARSFGREYLLSEAILDELSKIVRIVARYEETRIDLLGLDFKNINGISYIKKINETNFYPLHEAASGYHSAIPIILTVNHFSEIEKRQRTFIIEEPEQNLFPKTQKKLVEFMVESVNKFDNQFILPTHSPYILTSLENLMYAYILGNAKNGKLREKVSNIINEKYWINPEDINAYYLNNGEAKDIMIREESLIYKDDLDEISDVLGKTFDKLIQIEIELEKKSVINDL